MKYNKTVIAAKCDVCQTCEYTLNCCDDCGKDICYDCDKKGEGKSFKVSVHFRSSDDAYYCIDCQGKLTVKPTELFSAYVTIVNLGEEERKFWEGFKIRQKAAESHLQLLKEKENAQHNKNEQGELAEKQ